MSAAISPDLIERYREVGFVVTLLVGALTFALGVAFLVIGVSVGTGPPAPYMTATDKYGLIALSVVGIAVGALVIRLAGKIVGW